MSDAPGQSRLPASPALSPNQLLVGVDVGATGSRAGVVDAAGHVLGRAKRETPRDPADAARVVAEIVREACQAAGIAVPPRLGIGVPGPVARNAITAAVNLGWRDVPFARLAAEQLGVPCTLLNDVDAAARAEHQAGAAAGQSDVLAVWIGTGVGGGAILGNTPLAGACGVAAEIGHAVIDVHAPPDRRLVEHRCSRRAILGEIRLRVDRGGATALREVAPAAVADAYRAGDDLVAGVVDEAMDVLGAAVASACAILGTRFVVVGGALAEMLGPAVCDRVGRAANADAFPPGSDIDVRLSAFGDDAGLIGAAFAAANTIPA
ncbi:MAG: ROK family protein [Planctomycetota bacterium]